MDTYEGTIGAALQRYADPAFLPTLQPSAIFRAVEHLDYIEALALIRAAYQASLSEAKDIYAAIMDRAHRRHWGGACR